MLEGLVANLLNRFLGMYVRNFDPKQLNVGIWSGDVKLRNLELRREALDQLHLPLNVVEGHLGELVMQIPWSNLRGKPVRINIQDVFILAAPKEEGDYNPEESEQREHRLKMEKLESAELLNERNAEGMSAEEQQRNQSFTSSLTTAIIDNVQVSVKNVHIRYEDSIANPKHPFAVGLTLSELSAVSTDENWKPAFVQSTATTSYKLATLGALAIYWDSDATLLGTGKGSQVGAESQGTDHDTLLEKFREMIITGDSKQIEEHQFILKPVSGRAGLEMDKTGKTDRPKMKARLLFDELGFVLDEDQYRDTLMLVDLFHYFIRHQEYMKYQPDKKPKEDPRAWLRFAGMAVLDKIHERNQKWSWDYMKERRDTRLRYIEIFKKSKREEKLTPEETEERDKIEHTASYEDLRFWRSLARNQLRKENVGVKKAPQKQTWGQWIWGSGTQQQEEEDDTKMTEQQRKELYDAIDWDEKKQLAEAVELPKDSVKLQVEMSLRSGGFTLKRDPHGKKTEILRLLFDSFSTKFVQRPESMRLELGLDGMRLYDGTTVGNLYPQVINIKDAPPVPDEDRIEEIQDSDLSKDADTQQEASGEEQDSTTRFFQLSFEKNPLDGRADNAIDIKLRAMEIVYNPKFVVEIAKFFRPPQRHMESIGALMETAGATVEGLRQQTRAGLEFALQEHKTIDAHFDLQAPLIIVPDSVIHKSKMCLIVDAGHASVTSELVDKKTLDDIRSKEGKQYTEKDYKDLEQLMYDKFILKLESTQVLLGSTVEETRAQLESSKSTSMHVIDRINMDFLVEASIVPQASDITKFRITGHLPVLHASVSDAKYKTLMKLIDVAIPKFNEESEQRQKTSKESSNRRRSQLPTDIDARTRRKSGSQLQYSTTEHDLVIDEERQEENSSKSRQNDAPRKKKDDIPVHQRNFEFKFTVEKLRGSLYRSDPDGKKPDQLLAELIADQFFLQFYQRPYDMVAEVKLKSLMVEDHVEENPTAEFKNIVSSEDVSSKSDQHLFSVRFVRVNPDSPEFKSRYESIGTNLDVEVSTINLIVTRKTLLTLLDFVLITFAGGDSASQPQKKKEDNPQDPRDAHDNAGSNKESDKIRVRAKLSTIAVVLNNDGIRLATLSLSNGNVTVLLTGKTMQVIAKLGNLSLVDDVNQGVSSDSPLRQLLTIEGDELADFKYETFDEVSKSYPGYDSSIFLRSGSLKINFLTEPYRKIMEFGVKFGKMQAIFNAARQAAADQASQMQERANKMHFDIHVKTPIVVFPRVTGGEKPQRDSITAYLGEIYAKNKFLPLNDSKKSEVANKLSAGINNVRLVSLFHYPDDSKEELEMLDKVDLDFKVTYVEHKPGYKRPDLEVQGSMSNLNLKVTQDQLKFGLELSRDIPTAFALEDDEDVEDQVEKELPKATVQPAKDTGALEKRDSDDKSSPSKQRPELGNEKDSWTKLDLVFKVGAIALELINAKDDEPVGDIKAQSLSRFSLNETNVKLRMMSDGALESELAIQSFNIKDTRGLGTNKFRKIMSLNNTDVKQQFQASLSMSGGTSRHLIALLTIDSPRVIVALDWLFAVKAFVDAALVQEEPLVIEDESADDSESVTSAHSAEADKGAVGQQIARKSPKQVEQGDSSMTTSYRVNLADAQVILIANPTISNSEAVVLSTKQVLVSQQNAMTLQVEKVGMFLCRMDKFETSKLRILDDLSIQTSLDMQSKRKDAAITSIHVDIEPVILRLSLRDILLTMQVVSKASEMNKSDEGGLSAKEPQKLKEITNDTAKSKRNTTNAGRSTTVGRPTAKTISTKHTGRPQQDSHENTKQQITMRREEMTMQVQGLRVVLIGDTHELPIVDWSVKGFNVDVRDWSSTMTADTNFDTYFNVFNFSKSAWEPLIEPWQLGFHMSQNQNPSRLEVELFSRKSLELTVTAATIALASKAAQYLATDEDILSKPRGNDAPYRIRNYTGFDMNIWAVVDSNEEGPAAKMADGEEIPWRFEDATMARESLSAEGASGVIGLVLEGSGFKSLDRISVTREGEFLYALQPRKDKILHRLLVEIKLGADNVKYITIRSPLVVENHTQIPVEIGVYNPGDDHLLKIEKIAPGEARPAPVGAAYMHSLVVRPDQGFGYTWSNEQLFWKELLKRPTRTIKCAGEHSDKESPPFYFQLNAVFDKNNPITGIYPYMKLRLAAPIEIQNLLPFDFKYRIYDKSTKKDWTNFLRKGGVSPVHVVELSHLLLISVDMQDTPFKPSDFAIINSPNRDDFKREKSLIMKDENDLQLRLKLHYYNIPNSGGAFKITVYSPYVLLNRTGLELDVRSKQFMSGSRSAAGRRVFVDTDDAQRAQPFMFSFNTDDRKNRALLKIGESNWSKPQSFDAIGSNYDVAIPSQNSRSEMHVGVSINEGEGKYKLTNVVTIAPRFVLKNKMRETINVREPGSADTMEVKSSDLLPLRYLKPGNNPQVCLCFPGVNNHWSAPFNVANVGTMHIKLAKSGQRQQLIRVEVLMESATIFLHISLETKHWPYSMRNESDQTFLFWQTNPNSEEGDDDRNSSFKPVRYKLPPRSIMPYAWDYPAAQFKEIVLEANQVRRHVKLAEIGNQIPMRLPPSSDNGRQKIVDINIMADGPTQTLVLSNFKPSKSLYRQKTGSATSSRTEGFEVKEQDSDVSLKARIAFSGIGLSLINAQLRELVYLTLREIELKYTESKLYQTLNSTVKWIQIDNQLYGGIFPILVYPSVVPKTGREMDAHPIFRANITRVKDDSYGVLYIKYFTVLIQQMTIELDEDFIFALLDFSKVPGVSWQEQDEGKLCDDRLDIPEPKQQQSGQDIYFELLHLQPMQFDLSFVRTERINAEDTGSPANPLMFAVNVLTMSIGNVNDAPIRYNALLLENARVSVASLINSIRSHYVQESLRQVHIVLGSADFLGNPVGLFNNVSSGITDIFYEPYQGLVAARPEELGLGIAKGASSFVKKSVFGLSDSVAKFTGSISKGLATATLDKEYQDQRRMSKSRNRPKHALYGITSGGNAFGSSLASGIGGLARHPLEGAEKEGLQGFVKGVGKGVLGMATKPAIGAFDLASNLAEGVRNTTTVFDQEGLDRVRLTRFIGIDGIVRPYSQREALGQFWLKTIDNGKYFNEDYIAHLELEGRDMLVMLTYNGILMVRSKKLTTEWDVPLKDIQTISKERTGMSIMVKGGVTGPFIPVQDEQSRNWLYKQVAVAVNAYNDKWNAKG